MAGISRSSTARVASGVTSRGESPRAARCHDEIGMERIAAVQQRRADPLLLIRNDRCMDNVNSPPRGACAATHGPLVSTAVPALQRSLTVSTAAV